LREAVARPGDGWIDRRSSCGASGHSIDPMVGWLNDRASCRVHRLALDNRFDMQRLPA
jgi:hypothetical protein